MGLKRGVLLFLLASLALVPSLPAAAADRGAVFTVAAVPVDATAASANAARDQARADGAQRAYQILIDRLTRAADRDRLPRANAALLDTLIGSFEVAHERRSGVRYLADYTYHFRPEAVRRLLGQAGVPFAATQSKPLVVLAVLDAASGAVLWEDPNPWRQAWAAGKPPAGLVPLVVPLGDVEDVAAIDAAEAEAPDDPHLQAISQRHGGADVLVTRAKLNTDATPHSVDVNSTRYTGPVAADAQTWVGSYAAKNGESDGDLLNDAVAGTIGQIGEAWKAANILDFGHAATLTATVPVTDLAGWVAIRDRLRSVPSIQHSDLVSLDRQAAHVTLHYVGDVSQLRNALAQRDLNLSGDDPDWVLQPRGVATAQ